MKLVVTFQSVVNVPKSWTPIKIKMNKLNVMVRVVMEGWVEINTAEDIQTELIVVAQKYIVCTVQVIWRGI
jgi:hypothetical protein